MEKFFENIREIETKKHKKTRKKSQKSLRHSGFPGGLRSKLKLTNNLLLKN